jgi:hypothetical protein
MAHKIAVVASGWQMGGTPCYNGNMQKSPKLIDKDGYVLLYLPDHHESNSRGYVREHRVVMEQHLKRNLKKGELVDHINGNVKDNRLRNLRLCTHKQNIRNSKLSRKNKSGYKGVSWDSTRNLWQASIKVNYRSIGLGRFKKKEDAALAYNMAATHYFGEFARINHVEI